MTASQQDQVQTLIDRLGNEQFEVRQRAAADLIEFGVQAAPLLRQAARGHDLERVRRAEECLREIADRGGMPLPGAAARLLALRKPAGALEALLDFVPFADNEEMSADVQKALAALAVPDRNSAKLLAPVLLRALDDRLAVKRLAAAQAILDAGILEHRPAVRKLLRDADPQVRLRLALALAARRDREAIPILIDSLADEPSELNGEAEEILYRLAGDRPPRIELAGDQAGRRKQRDAWAAWWKQAGSTIDLVVVEDRPRQLGFLLLVGANSGQVTELDRDGKRRWTISGLGTPVDAHVLPGNRVLIVEYQGKRVSERDFQGKILWKKEGLADNPTSAQRLRSGNTFIVTDSEMLEVDPAGKTVWSRPYPGLNGGYKSRDGVITCVIAGSTCVRFSSTGVKELASFGVSGARIGCVDAPCFGRILLAQQASSSVCELDATGRVLWQAPAPGITTASRLPNGHALVASTEQRSVTELDRTGKVVWEYKADMPVFRARRR